MADPRALLATFAHPDDEVFGTGGTLALYASEGVRVSLVCATREAADRPLRRSLDSCPLAQGQATGNELNQTLALLTTGQPGIL